MIILRPDRIPPSEITSPGVFAGRRHFLASAGYGIAALALGAHRPPARAAESGRKLEAYRHRAMVIDDKLTPYDSITGYGNFYEFGPDKDSPARHAHQLQTHPWSVTIDGEVKATRTFAIDDILKWAPLEERIYRLRCVEGWSAVVPWIGFPFSEVLKRVELTGNAKFVEFHTLADPRQMPYVRVPLLDWPYVEGLRLDEAMHPLTLIAVGLYGEVLPKQNGAPLRLVVPWKYGFKSAKSLVRIRFVEKQPATAWMKAAPEEYGFYSNVNPDVPHRRWSQSRERRLGELFRRPTLPFNGYGDQVAHLYAGMDLRKHY